MTDQFDLVTTYQYDELNRLASLTDPDGDSTTYQYDAIGQLTQTVYPTGTKINQQYNDANLLTKIENINSANQLISSFEYQYDYNANRISMLEGDNDYTQYEYDMENRLAGVTYPDGTGAQYHYDARNNIVQIDRLSGGSVIDTVVNSYDSENRQVQYDGYDLGFDDNGNLIEADTEYAYYSTFLNGKKMNVLDRVGPVDGGSGPGTTSSDGGEISTDSTNTDTTWYDYALDGRRVGKSGAVDMKYLYDGENVVYELWDDKTVRFTHPISRPGGLSTGCGNANAGIFFTDHPVSIKIDDSDSVGSQKYYYLYDGLGSVTGLIDASENVVNSYRYTPFGDDLIKSETVYNPHQYTGRQYDFESGLYHYRARAYSPEIYRFMQQDPAGMVDGANMYAYVGNNPVNGVDPGGMHFIDDLWDALTGGPSYEGTSTGYEKTKPIHNPGDSAVGTGTGIEDCAGKCACKKWGGDYQCNGWERYLLGWNDDCYTDCLITNIYYASLITYGAGKPPGWKNQYIGYAHM